MCQLPESTIIENLGKEYASDPVVVAVTVDALRYVKHKDTNSEIDKKLTVGDTTEPERSTVARARAASLYQNVPSVPVNLLNDLDIKLNSKCGLTILH